MEAQVAETAKPGQGAKPLTRIQARNRETILEAALDVFSAHGFRGATVDQIASSAGLSKPNLLYYFASKESMHVALLAGLMDTWLDPLRDLNSDGDPIEEIMKYVHRKLEMSRDLPRQSRLFANEVLQGAPHLSALYGDTLNPLVEQKVAIIAGWSDAGKIAKVHPYHLLFSIWSLTQHYADFDVQVRAVLPDDEAGDPFPQAANHLDALFRNLLTP